jgi:hypothetical protein
VEKNSVKIKTLLIWLIFFNFCDALITVYILQNNLGTELNPLAALLYAIHPIFFIFIKTIYVCFVAWIIHSDIGNNSKEALQIVKFIFVFYAFLFIYQIVILLTV